MVTWSGGNVLSASSWTKSSGPVFQQTASVKGPGGPSVVPSADGSQDGLVYHSNAYSSSGWLRRVINLKHRDPKMLEVYAREHAPLVGNAVTRLDL